MAKPIRKERVVGSHFNDRKRLMVYTGRRRNRLSDQLLPGVCTRKRIMTDLNLNRIA